MRKLIVIILFSGTLLSCENNDISLVEKTLIIASKKVDCVGVEAQKCLLIKENENQEWNYFYDAITGFEYEEGFEYEITVTEQEIENPPQDGASLTYSLVEIISKIEKKSENIPN